jgi:hypothetical protein
MYSGNHEMSAAQYATALKLSAAICDFHGWTDKSVIAHGEWSDDKWDPGYAPGKIMDMTKVRADVKKTIVIGANPTPAKPTTPVEVKVPNKTTTYKEVWDLDVATPPTGHATADNPKWAPMSLLKGIFEQLDAVSKKLDAIEKKLGI